MNVLEIVTDSAYQLYKFVTKTLIALAEDKSKPLPQELFVERTFNGFMYTEKGVTYAERSESRYFKPSLPVVFKSIFPLISESTEYLNLLSVLHDHCADRTRPEDDIMVFIRKILELYFKPASNLDSAIKNLLWRWVRDLTDQPHHVSIRLELQGVILESFKVELPQHWILRQTTEADLAIPIESHMMEMMESSHYLPYAILESTVELNPEYNNGKHSTNDLQAVAKRYVGILLLFEVGSVYFQTFTMETDLVVN
ncbi:MAG: hypothetical protein ACN4EP_01845, partial [Sediminibacterium sp.]